MPPSDAPISAVVEDLALHPETTFAVILHGQLLPMRFAKRAEASGHLVALINSKRDEKEHAA